MPPPTPKRKPPALSSNNTKKAKSESALEPLSNKDVSTSEIAHSMTQPNLELNDPSQSAGSTSQLTSRISSIASVGSSTVQDADDTSWDGLAEALQKLRVTTEIFPPIHSAIHNLKACLHIFEEAAKPRKDYGELALGLKNMVELLDKHFANAESEDMMDTIKNIAEKITREIESIDKRQSRSGVRRVLGASENEDDLIRRYRRIEQLFRQLHGEASMSSWNATSKQLINTRLEGLRPVKLACFDSELAMDIGRRSCTENTRTQILDDFMAWADDDSGRARIYWMSGMAGTGKTTIAYSMCEKLGTSGQLAASFFCTRASGECREAKRIIPTIAYQLARRSAPFRHALCAALDEDPDIGDRIASTQLELLLVKPLQKAKGKMASNLVVVIDALDECSDSHVVERVLRILFRFANNLPVKFMVTSRPEPAIRNSMMTGISEPDRPNSILYLHEIEKSLVQADIKLYLKDELDYLLPGHFSDIEELAEQAGNLFIYAATAVRYIKPVGKAINSKERLKTMLELNNKSNNSLSPIDALYSIILSAAIHDGALESKEQDNIQVVLRTVICACEPLLVDTIAALSGLSERDQVLCALEPLRSVLHVSEHTSLVTTLHASFPDYMFSRDRSKDFFFDKLGHSQLLVRSCLDIMKAQLRFNICQLESSFILDEDIPDLQERADANISPELFYACRFWADHLTHTKDPGPLIGLVLEFLSQRLLFWMEVLNLRKCMVIGAVSSTMVHMWLRSSQVLPDQITLAYDAQTFVGKYASHELSASTPQIYLSAIPLCSPRNLIRRLYQPKFTGLIRTVGTLIEKIDEASLGIWTSGSPIRSASFSADRKYIVLGEDSGRISVRHSHSGKGHINFLAHRKVITAVAFSSDTEFIVSSSHDQTLCIWNTSDGSLASGPFRGHTNRVNSAIFSPDGLLVASGSEDHTIRIWTTSDHSYCRLTLRGHTAAVKSAVFSPDGLKIVSGSQDHTVRVWDVTNGVSLRTLEGHTGAVSCVQISTCGTFIVSGSNDRTIRTWSAHDGASIGNPLQGHSNNITSIAVSPEGERIVSGSLDHAVRVWHRKSGELIAGPFLGHTNSVRSVDFSADGARIISASDDKTVRVWNAQGKAVQAKERSVSETSSILLTAVSPSGSHLASGHKNGSIRVWNVQGAALESELPCHYSKHQEILLLTFSSDGDNIIAAYKDGLLHVFNAQVTEMVGDPRRFSPNDLIKPQPIAISSSDQRIVSTGGQTVNQALDLWDLRANRLVRAIKAPNIGDPFEAAVFSSNTIQLATGTKSGVINLWDSNNGQHIAGPFSSGTSSSLTSLGISPDSTRIFYKLQGEVPILYNVTNDTHTRLSALKDIKSHESGYAIFSPSGTHVIYVSRGGAWTIGLYNTHDARVDGSKHKIRLSNQFNLNITGLRLTSDESCLISAFHGQELLVQRLHERGHYAVNKASANGWILDENSNKVIWVPPEIRSRFPPASGSNFTEHDSITVDYENMLVGKNWSGCYIRE